MKKSLFLLVSGILLAATHIYATCSVQVCNYTNPTCFGQCNATAGACASGGVPPFTYTWSTSPAQHGATATNLCAGTYTCSVSDGVGCLATATVTITQPSPITISVNILSNVSCNGGNNGCAHVTVAGGTPGYTYAWMPTGGPGATACNLTAGTYTCYVSDSHGCSATATCTITQPAILAAVTQTLTNVSCFNGNNGSATVSAIGGTLPYSYLWTPGGGTGVTAFNLAAGTYTVTVTDSHGCTITSTAVVTQPPVLAANASTVANVSCNGGNNGLATVMTNGGTPGYTYQWSPSGGTGQTASNLVAGTYTVTVTDSHGCTITSTAVITQPPPLTLSLSSTNATCSTCCDGSATAVVGGGTTPYAYLWQPGGPNNLCPGNYTCTITDAHGCTTSQTVTINYNCGPPTVQASNITFTNATQNSVTVHWTNGNGSRRIVKMKLTNTFTPPANGNDYTSSSNYSGGEQVVYNGTGNSVNITGLASNTSYWFRVYEANCTSSTSDYLSTAAFNNPRRVFTLPSQNPNRPEPDNSVPSIVNSFQIIPNPAHNTFTISLPDESGIGNHELKIFDITGRVVHKQTINSKHQTLNTKLSGGVYFVRVEAGDKLYQQKLVIE